MKTRGKVSGMGTSSPLSTRRSPYLHRAPGIQLASASVCRAPVAAPGASAAPPSMAAVLLWLCATVCITFLSTFYHLWTLSLICLSPMTTRSSCTLRTMRTYYTVLNIGMVSGP